VRAGIIRERRYIMHKESGTTLVELLISISIAVILTTQTVAGFFRHGRSSG